MGALHRVTLLFWENENGKSQNPHERQRQDNC